MISKIKPEYHTIQAQHLILFVRELFYMLFKCVKSRILLGLGRAAVNCTSSKAYIPLFGFLIFRTTSTYSSAFSKSNHRRRDFPSLARFISITLSPSSHPARSSFEGRRNVTNFILIPPYKMKFPPAKGLLLVDTNLISFRDALVLFQLIRITL